MNLTFKKAAIAGSLIALSAPLMAFAQSNATVLTIMARLTTYLNQFLLLLMAVAVVMFVWYIIKYFIKADADRKEGGTYVMYSLIGFFVILSFWGLVNILQNSFGLQNEVHKPRSWNSFQNLFPSGTSGTPAPAAPQQLPPPIRTPGTNNGTAI